MESLWTPAKILKNSFTFYGILMDFSGILRNPKEFIMICG
jgi:hypothetical protein